MSDTTLTTSLSTVGIPPSVTGLIRLRGEAHESAVDPITVHSAQRQAPAPAAEGRRNDREYPPVPEGNQPAEWPVGEGIPPYRALNYDVDVNHRPWAGNPADVRFVRTMLSGVLVVGTLNKIWRCTVGRFYDGFWKYPLGGDY